RKAVGEVVAWTAVEPHLRASLAGNDAEAVMFDLMQPMAAGRQLIGFCWKTRRDEPGRQGTLHRRCPTLFTSAAAGRGAWPARRSIKSFVYNDPAELERADDLVVQRPIAGKNHAD